MIRHICNAWLWASVAIALTACALRMPSAGPDQPISNQPGQAGSPGPAGAGTAVRGRVTDADGRPISGVLVAAQSADSPPNPIPEIAVYTDDQGNYRWALPAGSYTLSFTHQDYAPVNQAVTLTAGQPTAADVVLKHR